jgi:rubrerythrin
MKTSGFRVVVAVALLAVAGASAFAAGTDFGAAGAAGRTGLSVQQMLTYAIQDEYLARAEYEAIMARYGTVRPFTNIIRAEEQHAAWLVDLFRAHGLAVPADTAKEKVVVPRDMKSALEAGVKAEIENIAMYDAFLGSAAAQPLPADVRAVFERLKRASENHLQAFRQNLERYQ